LTFSLGFRRQQQLISEFGPSKGRPERPAFYRLTALSSAANSSKVADQKPAKNTRKPPQHYLGNGSKKGRIHVTVSDPGNGCQFYGDPSRHPKVGKQKRVSGPPSHELQNLLESKSGVEFVGVQGGHIEYRCGANPICRTPKD
jgi:hypothetical protein